MKRIFLRMGSVNISSEPAVITTILGSCVSTCIWDSRLGYGGINHFKAPVVPLKKQPSAMYGEVAMRELLDGMIKNGSKKKDLRAMLFGGGSVIPVVLGSGNIGKMNIDFAKEALKKENIRIVSSHTGQDFGRKLTFDTSNGTVNVSRVSAVGAEALNLETE